MLPRTTAPAVVGLLLPFEPSRCLDFGGALAAVRCPKDPMCPSRKNPTEYCKWSHAERILQLGIGALAPSQPRGLRVVHLLGAQ